MNILYDTNIILDVFLERHPFFENSAYLLDLAEKRLVNGWLGATTLTTIYYLLNRELSSDKSEKIIQSLFDVFNVAPVNRFVLNSALEINFKDNEDAILHQSAFHSNLDGIVTRNKKDFSKAKLSVYTPQELLVLLE